MQNETLTNNDKEAIGSPPMVTVVVPSFNQGQFLERALESIFRQDVPTEVFVMDGGSTDCSVDIINKWAPRLADWSSAADDGQAAAINQGMTLGKAPYVCWLNSDDFFYPGALRSLVHALESGAHFAYGKCWTVSASGKKRIPYLTCNFSPRLFANFCFICQPGTLMTRQAWEESGGLDSAMQMAFDYDLWWRLIKRHGAPVYCRSYLAATRDHGQTKTATRIEQHYSESIQVVRRHWGSVPIKWRVVLPIMRAYRSIRKYFSNGG